MYKKGDYMKKIGMWVVLLVGLLIFGCARTGKGAEVVQVKRSEAVCYPVVGSWELPEYVSCTYGIVVNQVSQAGTANLKMIGKEEIYKGGSFSGGMGSKYNYDGELMGKYDTGAKVNANEQSQLIWVADATVEGNTVNYCAERIISVDGDSKVLKETCT